VTVGDGIVRENPPSGEDVEDRVKNTDARIDAYIAKSASFAQPILSHLRALVHVACPRVEETMKWSMPSFLHEGRILCGMAAFKEHCTFGFWHKGMVEVLGMDAAKGANAMGSFGRISAIADLPKEKVLLRYLREAVKLGASDEPARPKPARKSAEPVAVPADLAKALKQNATAASTFRSLSPSHRKEYVEWITEAKRDETRRRRLATTLEWLAEGKSRNWKYEKC
jgi:uncharacterized protein YdeI (YjbR/CyaY-like superfamily)